MNGRSPSKKWGQDTEAEGTAEAKAECPQSARKVKSDGRVSVRFLKEGGTKDCGGSAEDTLCRASHTRHGHGGTPGSDGS